MASSRRWVSEVVTPILIVIFIDLAITFAFLYLSGQPSRVGTLRPVATIPSKWLELGAVGAGVGLIASAARRAFDPPIIILGAAFVLLVDIDHLPSLLGIAQPIRPAHSIAFLIIETFALLVFVKKWSVALVAIAAFFGHLAADTGLFAPFQPFSFQYISLDAYAAPLALASVAFALAAGLCRRREARRLSFYHSS